MPGTTAIALCSSCHARLARDNDDTTCSPCRRREIETSARHGAAIAQNRVTIKSCFDRTGLHGVADHLDCTVAEALDIVVRAQLIPAVSTRRQSLLRHLVALGDISHVAAAEALGISRWTVATYRRQLGLDKVLARSMRPRNW